MSGVQINEKVELPLENIKVVEYFGNDNINYFEERKGKL